MKTIWKFPLTGEMVSEIPLPSDAKVLAIGIQAGMPTMWAMLDPEAERTPRRIFQFVTGERIPDHLDLKYIATLTFNEATYVLHFFEEIEESDWVKAHKGVM